MFIGYGRICAQDPTGLLQQEALEQAGCRAIFTDTTSGAKGEQPELAQALAQLQAGDTLVVWRLDRLGRSLKHLIEMVTTLHERQIGFLSVSEALDTRAAEGQQVLQVFSALAAFEQAVMRERTQVGLQAAKARGRKGGRPRTTALNTPEKVAMAQALYREPYSRVDDLCQVLNISRATLYRYVKVKPTAGIEGQGDASGIAL